jgi:hypothetical protein
MRIHLPALIALASATTYAACGSSDASKALQEGGAGGEAGETAGSGGSNNAAAGSKNGGGSANNVAGQAGENSSGGQTTGQGGASGGDSGMLGGASGTDAAGAGGSGETPGDMSLPAACPGVLADYTLLVGTSGDDAFTTQDVGGKKLIFGLEGMDSFPKEHGGEDCIVGGPGDDDFTNSDEFANYYFGGGGADTYHIDTTGNYVRIADMASGDVIALSKVTFTFLTGASGDVPQSTQVLAVPGYSTGTSSGVVEVSSIIYDPTSGELWLDTDGGVKGVNDKQILTIVNKDGYTFDIDDFELE